MNCGEIVSGVHQIMDMQVSGKDALALPEVSDKVDLPAGLDC